jgi:hypothetical protein
MLGEFVRFTTGVAPLVSAGRLMEIRFDDLSICEVERWERDSDCPVCSRATDPMAAVTASARAA